MKISTEGSDFTIKDTSIKENISTSNFGKLNSGDKFKAEVVDINPNRVTLKFSTGETLTAKSLILPDAVIGDEAIFLVKESFKGQVLLEMLKPDNTHLKEGIIKEALRNSEMPLNKENFQLAKDIMENGLPLTKEVLQKADAMKFFEGQTIDLDKMLFFLKENIPTTKANFDMLRNFSQKNFKLGESVEKALLSLVKNNPEFIDEIAKTLLSEKTIENSQKNISFSKEDFSNLGNTKDYKQIKEVLNNMLQDKDYNGFLENIKDNIYLNLDKKDSFENFKNYYKELITKLDKVLEKSEKLGLNNESFAKELIDIKESIKFMNHINEHKNYLQIPFSANGKQNTGEIYVFKDSKKNKNLKESASILVALDNINLGRVEVFVNKTFNNLQLQFKVENEKTLKLVFAGKTKLTALLTEKGYKISGFNFKKMDESFSISSDLEKKEKEPIKRYSFDMRV